MRMRTRLVPLLLLALALTGCESTVDGPDAATANGAGGGATSTTGPGGSGQQDQALRFAQCIRENGVPEFPDPEPNEQGGSGFKVPDGVDQQRLQAAQQKCQQFQLGGGEPPRADPKRVEQQLNYAKCMRENGVPNFPDPTEQGLQVDSEQLGMSPNDPRFKAAQEKCNDLRPRPPGGQGTGTGSGG